MATKPTNRSTIGIDTATLELINIMAAYHNLTIKALVTRVFMWLSSQGYETVDNILDQGKVLGLFMALGGHVNYPQGMVLDDPEIAEVFDTLTHNRSDE